MLISTVWFSIRSAIAMADVGFKACDLLVYRGYGVLGSFHFSLYTFGALEIAVLLCRVGLSPHGVFTIDLPEP